jgi:hypothetical protein
MVLTGFSIREKPHRNVAQKHKLTPRRWLDLSRAITTFDSFCSPRNSTSHPFQRLACVLQPQDFLLL